MTQQFDPAQFLDMETDQPLIKRPPLPVQDYHAIIGEVTSVGWAKDDKSGARLVVPLKIEVPPAIQEQLHIHLEQGTITLSDTIFLDLTPDGLVDYSIGKNNKLRRYREALDMNRPGYTFSPRKMIGQPLTVKVNHEIYEGEIQERIGGIAKLS